MQDFISSDVPNNIKRIRYLLDNIGPPYNFIWETYNLILGSLRAARKPLQIVSLTDAAADVFAHFVRSRRSDGIPHADRLLRTILEVNNRNVFLPEPVAIKLLNQSVLYIAPPTRADGPHQFALSEIDKFFVLANGFAGTAGEVTRQSSNLVDERQAQKLWKFLCAAKQATNHSDVYCLSLSGAIYSLSNHVKAKDVQAKQPKDKRKTFASLWKCFF